MNSMVTRRGRKVAAFAVLLIIVCILLYFGSREVQAPAETLVTDDMVRAAFKEDAPLSPAYPEHMRIPSIGVDAPFAVPLGVDSNKEIEVPEGYEEVAYYKHGPTPGQLGPAVVLGHVDSVAGPAVFYSLGQLEEGDLIEIDREDGVTAIFEVERLERHEQRGFPTRKVYGDLAYAGLRLITCSGSYDREIQRYSHNLIVFARLVDSREGEDVEKLDI